MVFWARGQWGISGSRGERAVEWSLAIGTLLACLQIGSGRWSWASVALGNDDWAGALHFTLAFAFLFVPAVLGLWASCFSPWEKLRLTPAEQCLSTGLSQLRQHCIRVRPNVELGVRADRIERRLIRILWQNRGGWRIGSSSAAYVLWVAAAGLLGGSFGDGLLWTIVAFCVGPPWILMGFGGLILYRRSLGVLFALPGIRRFSPGMWLAVDWVAAGLLWATAYSLMPSFRFQDLDQQPWAVATLFMIRWAPLLAASSLWWQSGALRLFVARYWRHLSTLLISAALGFVAALTTVLDLIVVGPLVVAAVATLTAAFVEGVLHFGPRDKAGPATGPFDPHLHPMALASRLEAAIQDLHVQEGGGLELVDRGLIGGELSIQGQRGGISLNKETHSECKSG